MTQTRAVLCVLLQTTLVVILPGITLARDYASPLKVDEAKRAWGTPVANQAISIVTDKAVYKPEEPIVLEATFKNVGSEEVYAVDAFAFDPFMYELKVLLPDGTKTPLTLYGKRFCERGTEGSCCTYMLQPGEQRRTQFALSRLFDFSRSGKYAISVKKTVFTKSMPKVESNTVEITIEDVGMPCKRVKENEAAVELPKEFLQSVDALVEQLTSHQRTFGELRKRREVVELALLQVMQSEDDSPRVNRRKAEAMRLLAVYGGPAAWPHLVRQFDFVERVGDASEDPLGLFPAASAIARIGKPALNELIRSCSAWESEHQFHLAAWMLKSYYRDDEQVGLFRLNRMLEKQEKLNHPSKGFVAALKRLIAKYEWLELDNFEHAPRPPKRIAEK